MRVAIYGRVSSERQEKEHTIGSQLEALRAYAAKNGMEIVDEFTDEGYSGSRLDRPALDRMRDLAERVAGDRAAPCLDEAERHDDQNRFGAEDAGEVGPGEKGFGAYCAKQGDDRQPYDDKTEPFELVAGISHDRS